MTGSYDVALICLNGHVNNWSAQTEPTQNSKFCEKCGKENITTCPNCQTTIRGWYRDYGVTIPKSKVPAYCHGCGNPYPWTTDSINAAKELVNLSTTFDERTKTEVIQAIEIGSTETAGTSVAAEKLKKYWPAAGKTLQDVITSVLSETAKKILLGP